MSSFWSAEDNEVIAQIAARHGFGQEAGLVMAAALVAGNRTMAQFSHPDFGGMGQWSQGGMLMIGDMFNHGLKSRVMSFAQDLADALQTGAIVPRFPSRSAANGQEPGTLGHWWPAELGTPSSSGAQNDQYYAVFPGLRRLAIRKDGRITVHDTGDHRIGGVSQQQGGGSSLSFSSQLGTVDLAGLPELAGQDAAVSAAGERPVSAAADSAPVALHNAPAPAQDRTDTAVQVLEPARAGSNAAPNHRETLGAPTTSGLDLLETIRRLAELKDQGILSEAEFSAKKTDLLARL